MKPFIQISLLICSVFTVFACANAERLETPAKTEVVEKAAAVRVPKAKKAAKKPKAEKVNSGEGFEPTLERYQTAKAVKMALSKRVYQALTSKEVKSKGEFYLEKGRMRIEFSAPDKGLLVLDGNYIWQATYLPEEFGGGVQVAKVKMSSLGKAGTWLAAIFGEKSLGDEFLIKNKEPKGSFKIYTLVPKHADDSDIKKLLLTVDEENKNIIAVSMVDELENEISYEFSDPKFDVAIPAAKFKFTPPKGAEIVEY